MKRVGAVLLWIAAYWMLSIAWGIARFQILSFDRELGPEPEMLIPLVPLVIGGGCVWLGIYLWRNAAAESPHAPDDVG